MIDTNTDVSTRPRPSRRYQFLLAETVSDTVCAAFPELRHALGPAGGSLFFGTVHGGAHLHDLLERFQNLGLTVLEMRQLPD